MSPTEQLTENHFKRVRKIYILLFGLVFLFSLFAQMTVQYYICQNSYYSHVVNIAGRQRMLSQRIARFANRLTLSYSAGDAQKLKESVQLFNISHTNLKLGNAEENIAKPFSNTILTAYHEISPLQQEISKAADCITNQCSDKMQSIELINNQIDIFLNKMDRIVFLSSRYAHDKVDFLSKLEFGFFALICLTMLIEIFLILIPFHKRLSEGMRQDMLHLERRSRLYHLAEVGEMNSEILHEINNYMAIIRGANGVLLKKLNKTDDQKIPYEMAVKIDDGIERILEVCKGMSSLSRISYVEDCQGSDIIASIIDIIGDKLERSGIQFNTRSHVQKIRSNKGQIIQILFNLIKNAMHAMEESEEKVIELKIEREGESVHFFVKDTGPGISEENRSKIFDAYFTTKEVGKGTGLGLSLSRKIANALDGDLQLLDDQQTTFRLTIRDQNYKVES